VNGGRVFLKLIKRSELNMSGIISSVGSYVSSVFSNPFQLQPGQREESNSPTEGNSLGARILISILPSPLLFWVSLAWCGPGEPEPEDAGVDGDAVDGDADREVDADIETPGCVEAWSRTFVGAGESDGFTSVQQTSDGGFMAAGHHSPEGYVRDYDGWLVRTDGEGREQWNRTFDSGGASDRFSSVQQTSDGGFILVEDTGYAGWLVRTDGEGIEQWNRIFGGELRAGFYSIQPTSDGGFMVAGDYARASGEYSYTYGWLVRTDGEGIEQWNRTFDHMGRFNSIQSTSDGGYILAGETEYMSYEGWLVRTDGEGIEQWSRTFGEEARFSSIQPTRDGGFIAAGGTGGAGWLVRTDGEGAEQWNRTFGVGDYYGFTSIQPTRDGGFIAAGYTGWDEYTGSSGWLVKVVCAE
jgi:hypothetical protein